MIESNTALRIHVRWQILRDLPSTVAIDARPDGLHWSADRFRKVLRDRQTISAVAEVNDVIAGFVVYKLWPKTLEVLNGGVDPAYRRRGVGTAIVNKLVAKLSSFRRTEISVIARESNLGAHLFLKAVGFTAEHIHPDPFETGEAGYEFMRRIEAADSGQQSR